MAILIKDMPMPPCCDSCPFCIGYFSDENEQEEEYRCAVTMNIITEFDARHYRCPLVETSDRETEINIYDEEEIYPNCTVQILRNSLTDDISVGWWENTTE